MSHESDLSAYEKLRLENIRRNHEFLAGLGLAPLQPKVVKVEVAQPPPRKVAPKVKREESPDLLTHDKRRRSGRLSGHFIKEEMLEETTEEAKPPAEPVETESFYERISQVRHLTESHHNHHYSTNIRIYLGVGPTRRLRVSGLRGAASLAPAALPRTDDCPIRTVQQPHLLRHDPPPPQ